MTKVESQYFEHKKEDREKNADGDWEPMCQAEVERVTRQETGYAPMYRAEGGGRREEGKKVINSQHVKPEEGDGEMDADTAWRSGGRGKTQRSNAETSRSKTSLGPPCEHSPPLARFNGEGRAGRGAQGCVEPEAPIPLREPLLSVAEGT